MSKRWFNPVDLCCVAACAMLVQWTLSMGQLMHQRAPRVTRVEPDTVREREVQWLKVRGEQFRDARLMIIGDRIISPLEETGEHEFSVRVKPETLGLLPGRYDIRVVNGWGRGEWLPDALTVIEQPALAPVIVVSGDRVIESKMPGFLQQAPSVWIVAEGWVRLTRPMLHAIRRRQEAYDISGRPVARIFNVAPDIFPGTSDRFALNQFVSPTGQSSPLAAAPSKWYVRHVTVKLLAQHWRGGFYFQGVQLVSDAQIVVTTPHYRIPMEIIGGAKPYDPLEARVTLRIRSLDLPAVNLLRSGDPIVNVHGDTVGRVIDIANPTRRSDGELRLWLDVEREGPTWWHERTKLRRGATLTVGTPQGFISGRISKAFPEQGP